MRTVIIILLINFASNAWANSVVTGSANGRLKGEVYLLTSLLEMRAVNFREGEIPLPNAITLFLKPYMEESFPLNIFSTAPCATSLGETRVFCP